MRKSAGISTGTGAVEASPLLGRLFTLKPFKTLDEQIQILEDRGLVITDKDFAKQYLLTNNYYNIINGYSKYFPHAGDSYTGGTTFEEVTHLYLFDRDVKQAFFRAILAAEGHLKASLAYRFAERFPTPPYAYLNTSAYDDTKILSVSNTISRLSNIIQRHQAHKGTSVSHYVKRYGDVPIWVLVNYLDFGELRYMLASAQTSLQNAVAADMHEFISQHIPGAGVFPPETMISFLENANDVRNVCAHNNRLIGFRCRRDSIYWRDLHSLYSISPASQRRDVFSVFISLRCFLTVVEYGALHNSVINDFKRLDSRLSSISVEDIQQTLGFPRGWHKSTPKYHA